MVLPFSFSLDQAERGLARPASPHPRNLARFLRGAGLAHLALLPTSPDCLHRNRFVAFTTAKGTTWMSALPHSHINSRAQLLRQARQAFELWPEFLLGISFLGLAYMVWNSVP